MNIYLESAYKRFSGIQQKDYTIAPISLIDCEIIVEVIELLKKYGANDIVEIFKNYKYFKDKDIRDLLLEANTNFHSEDKKVEDGKDKLLRLIEELKEKLEHKRKFITINNDKLVAELIFHYSVTRDFDVDENFVGCIILNPTDKSATKVPLYANYTFKVYDEEKFDELIDSLDEQLISAGVEFVKNKDK